MITQLPIQKDLRIYKGVTFKGGFIWKPAGVPMDWTGCKARLRVFCASDRSRLLLELRSELDKGIVLGAEPGALDYFLGATQTEAIEWSEGLYELDIEYPAGADHVDRFMCGHIRVEKTGGCHGA